MKETDEVDYMSLGSYFVKQRNTFTTNRLTEFAKDRRFSDSPFMTFKDNPSIIINTIDKENIETETNIKASYSEMAQDGYIEFLQALTEKILGSANHIDFDDSSCNLEITTETPLTNMDKYFGGMKFKNPFMS